MRSSPSSTSRPRYKFYPSSDDVRVFLEDLDKNMLHIETHILELQDQEDDATFFISLRNYQNIHDNLTSKQAWHACRMWQEVNSAVGEQR